MKQIGPIKAKVHKVERLQNSYYGNPKWAVTLEGIESPSLFGYEDDGFETIRTYKTRANCGWVYGVSFQYLEGKDVYVVYHETPKGRLVLDNLICFDKDYPTTTSPTLKEVWDQRAGNDVEWLLNLK